MRLKDKLFLFKGRKKLLSLLLFAVFGLLNQFCLSFSAIQETNAGTATVLQYVYPVGDLDLYLYQGQGGAYSGWILD